MIGMELNKDIKKRDEIIWGSYNPEPYLYGGIRYFDGMKIDTLKKLVELKFADPEDCQNCAPSIEEFVKFMENNDGYVVNGYAISDKRDDYRVSIEAIQKIDEIQSKEELETFIEFARMADEFTTNGYAWWD